MFVIVFITVSNSRSPGNFCLTEGKVGFETGTFQFPVKHSSNVVNAILLNFWCIFNSVVMVKKYEKLKMKKTVGN